jgi:hypothetical protein
MKSLGTFVHRLTELPPNHCLHREIFIMIISLNNVSLRFDEETEKLRKQEQCACYLC